MNYEQKYKEAFERAKKIYDNAKELRCVVEAVNLETIFPELNESEDKKAKRIILALPFKHEADYKFVKTWLEKQGEPKQEWSEEDERICQCLIKDQEESLDEVRNDKYGHSEIISDLKEMYRERINWLKMIKEKRQNSNKIKLIKQ